jgi:hypothetical protein
MLIDQDNQNLKFIHKFEQKRLTKKYFLEIQSIRKRREYWPRIKNQAMVFLKRMVQHL